MKTILSTFIFSILGLNIIFAQEKLNFDDPKVQDQIIATAAKELDERKKANGESLYYLPFSQVPYSGWYVGFYVYEDYKGQLQFLASYKDGKNNGPYVRYNRTGEIEVHSIYKNNIKQTMDEFYLNGQKMAEATYKEGLWSVKCWKKDGEKCPVTNIKDGNGVWQRYDTDSGEAVIVLTFKNGKLVEE